MWIGRNCTKTHLFVCLFFYYFCEWKKTEKRKNCLLWMEHHTEMLFMLFMLEICFGLIFIYDFTLFLWNQFHLNYIHIEMNRNGNEIGLYLILMEFHPVQSNVQCSNPRLRYIHKMRCYANISVGKQIKTALWIAADIYFLQLYTLYRGHYK